jgi:exopolysaccharide biosynthesis protein
MGNFINNLLDNLISTTWRLMDLPLYFLLLLIVVLLIVFNRFGRKWLKKLSDQKRLYINAILVLLMLLFIVDMKFSFMKAELTGLNEKIRNSQFNGSSVVGGTPFDLTEFKKQFPESDIKEKSVHEAVQLMVVTQKDPNSVVYIARIDLSHPDAKIQVSPEKKGKYLTSKFAKAHKCMIAINGEAGESMAMDCDLGEWSGNWVSKGKPVMMVDTDKRPFMGFNKLNKGTYYEESFVDTKYNDNYYNAIWGRFDILKKGNVLTHERDRPYARTVMGLSKDGTQLYLMIVDGKRPDHSVGLTYNDCATMLKSLGADDAMACDQGGSSCMYVKNMGGIINRPADSEGIERPIYSHFGVSF